MSTNEIACQRTSEVMIDPRVKHDLRVVLKQRWGNRMSSKVMINLQLCVRDRGDCAKGDLARSASTFMVDIDLLVDQR